MSARRLVVGLFVVLAACAPRVDDDSTGTASGAGASSSIGAGGGASASSATGAAGGGGEDRPYRGRVAFFRSDDGLEDQIAFFAASTDDGDCRFYSLGLAHGTLVGNCCVVHDNPPAGYHHQVSAGHLALRNPASGVASTYFFDDGTYLLDGNDLVSWKPTQTLTFDATGEVVGAFHVEGVAPAAIEGLSPPLDAPFVVHKSAGVEVTFAPAGASFVELSILTEDLQVSCRADDAAGTVTIPPDLVASAHGDYVYVSILRASAAHVLAPNAEVELDLLETANWPDGGIEP